MNKETAINPIEKKKRALPGEMMILIILIAMFIVLSIASNKFMTWDNMTNLMKQTSINGVVAIGMTFVIISSGIDLSVGAIVGFSGILASMLMVGGWGIAPSVLVAIAASAGVGVANGVLVHDGKVPPFIATLGTMTIVRGVIMLITDARMISGMPDDFINFATSTILGIPALAIIWIVAIIIAILILKFTVFGRNVYSIGSNEEATRLSGVNIRLNIYGIYLVSALCSAVAGIMLASRVGNGLPKGGDGYELDAIAASVVGGASLSGGEGSIVGTVIGALIMQTLRNGGNLLGVNSFILEICIGSLIIVAVLIDKAKKK
ncbi:ABC transporter permease [Christensenella tenuis]|jgi:ribose/xylose/arabinose/galactoside ABC-type transport system permease subunit|uniref:ABC transporter permease n=1 Tax=Christensenella tenuis TaxID=2763033 RepID=A0ABR7EF02_9FIRM|nr:ABC transporter permease [Christensenella tenuis]MBC5648233.1 ABC transporter permease [Christensenella tenuis]